MDPYVIEAIFLCSAILGSLGIALHCTCPASFWQMSTMPCTVAQGWRVALKLREPTIASFRNIP